MQIECLHGLTQVESSKVAYTLCYIVDLLFRCFVLAKYYNPSYIPTPHT